MTPEETARRMIDAERIAQQELGRNAILDDVNTPADWMGFQKMHLEWSNETFGIRPPTGPLKHLAKEVQETIDAPDDITEYGDCMALLLDAAAIAGITTDEIFAEMLRKHEINKARDWAPTNADGFSEHVRG